MVKERKATIKSLYCDKCGTEIPERNRNIYPIERYIYTCPKCSCQIISCIRYPIVIYDNIK